MRIIKKLPDLNVRQFFYCPEAVCLECVLYTKCKVEESIRVKVYEVDCGLVVERDCYRCIRYLVFEAYDTVDAYCKGIVCSSDVGTCTVVEAEVIVDDWLTPFVEGCHIDGIVPAEPQHALNSVCGVEMIPVGECSTATGAYADSMSVILGRCSADTQ